jgi:hypothetical protein
MSAMPLEAGGALSKARDFLQENAAAFREIARVYVVRMGLAQKGDAGTPGLPLSGSPSRWRY